MVCNDYFLADADELSAAFPGWGKPPENPEEYDPATYDGGSNEVGYVDLPWIDLKPVGFLELQALAGVLLDLDEDEADHVVRTVLIGPPDFGAVVFETPPELLEALVALDGAALSAAVGRWLVILRSDAASIPHPWTRDQALAALTPRGHEDLLRELRDLARKASGTTRRLFLFASP